MLLNKFTQKFLSSTTDKNKINFLFTYHSRFIPEGVAEASQMFLRDPTVYQYDSAMRNIIMCNP
jgi:hypothetical protein